MSYNDYLNDPKVGYTTGPVPNYSHAGNTPSRQSFRGDSLSLGNTKIGIALFVLSFAVFFTLGMISTPMWIVSMLIGIVAHVFSFVGAIRAKGSILSIVVAFITAIPAYLSCMFLLLGVVIHINRMIG